MDFSKMQMPLALSQLWDVVVGTVCCTHALLSHRTVITLCAAPAKQTDVFLSLSLLYVSPPTVKLTHRHTLKHMRTASYTAVIVDCKFMAQSSIPRVPGPLKYPPPPTISPLQSAKTPAEWGLGDAEVSYFLQSSCGEVTSFVLCSVVFLSLLTQPTPEQRPLQGLVSVFIAWNSTFCIKNISAVPFISHVIF